MFQKNHLLMSASAKVIGDTRRNNYWIPNLISCRIFYPWSTLYWASVHFQRNKRFQWKTFSRDMTHACCFFCPRLSLHLDSYFFAHHLLYNICQFIRRNVEQVLLSTSHRVLFMAFFFTWYNSSHSPMLVTRIRPKQCSLCCTRAYTYCITISPTNRWLRIVHANNHSYMHIYTLVFAILRLIHVKHNIDGPKIPEMFARVT